MLFVFKVVFGNLLFYVGELLRGALAYIKLGEQNTAEKNSTHPEYYKYSLLLLIVFGILKLICINTIVSRNCFFFLSYFKCNYDCYNEQALPKLVSWLKQTPHLGSRREWAGACSPPLWLWSRFISLVIVINLLLRRLPRISSD